MFNSQMVRPKIVEPSSGPLFQSFPRKWCALKLQKAQFYHFFAYFPRKWYALKLSNPQVEIFVHVSIANGPP